MINDLLKEETVRTIYKYIESNNPRIELNEKLFTIYEGLIGPQLEQKMIDDLTKETYDHAKERKAPINVLRRVIDKLSNIYQQEPKREVVDGKDSDARLVEKFEEILDINHKFNINNELWNLYFYSLLQISSDDGKPFIRSIPNHKFLIMNTSETDPTSSDVVILFMESEEDEITHAEVKIYWVYTDDQFAIYDSTPKLRPDLMEELGQDGTNPLKKIPFMYLNRSENLPMPTLQSDTLDMTLLIPLILSDVNYIAKFTTYSIMYGIDIDDANMKIGPNVFWKFKSDDQSEKTPSVGTIKPEGDIEQLLGLATSQLAVWLDTKGIKAGSIGPLSVDTAASGISKLIDESSVTEIRKFQATLYSKYETEFWDLLLNTIYPFWKEQGLIEDYGTFSAGAKVIVNFAPQTPLTDRGIQVKDLQAEVQAGFNTKRRAIQMLNPNMTDSEVDILLAEIEAEREVEVFTNGEETDTQQNEDEDNAIDTGFPA